MSTTAVAAPRRSLVLADLVATTRVRDFGLVVGLALLIAASAQLKVPVPLSLVPVTAQTFVVLLGGAVLGPTRGAAGAALYVAAGLAGVPWFAVTGGATSGYLVGFVVAAAVAGLAARREHDRTVPGALGLMVAGNVVIYALGVSGLMLIASLDLPTALSSGVTPFLIGDTVKIALAGALLPAAWRWVAADA